VRQRMLTVGGYEAGGDETMALSLTGTSTWSQIPTLGTYPRRREGATLIIDAPRGRVVLFGGFGNYGPLADVWTTPLAGPLPWTRLYPGGAHLSRYHHAAVYDSVGQRMIVFGGVDVTNTASNETWSLALTGTPTWSLLSPSGTPPVGRETAPAAYDSQRRRMLVFGGSDGLGASLGDLWALDLAGGGSWSEIVAAGAPGANYFATLVYDAPRDRAVVAAMSADDNRTHVWTLPLSGGSWGHVPPQPDTPEISQFEVGVFDRNGNRMLIQEGEWTYALSLLGTPAWYRVGGTDSTVTLFGASTVFDPVANRMLAFAGYVNYRLNSLWALEFPPNLFSVDARGLPSFGGSVVVSPADECFTSSSTVTLTAVPTRGFQFTQWSGDASGSVNPITVTLNASKQIRANFTQPPRECDSWRLVGVQTDQIPVGLEGMVYDSDANRILGVGINLTGGLPTARALGPGPGGDWTSVLDGAPSTLMYSYGCTAYDPIRNRLLIYTVWDEGVVHAGDVWALNLTGTPAYSLVAPAGGPPLRYYATLVYDGGRDQLVLFGGTTQISPSSEAVLLNDAWRLSLSGAPAWTQLTPSGTPPKRRFAHSAIYDPKRNRMLVYGGLGFTLGLVPEVWSLTLGGSPAWSQIVPVGPGHPSQQAAAVYDPLRDRMLLLGGWVPTPNEDVPTAVTALSLKYDPAWIRLSPDGLYPQRVTYNLAAYDSLSDRVILAGGSIVHSNGFNEANPRTYDLALAGEAWLDLYTTPPAYGTVTASPASDSHAVGSQVTLTAIAGTGYAFDHWTGDASGNTNPLTVTMNDHKVIGAVFALGPVATTISRFDATRGDGGVELTWSFGAKAEVEAASVERADQASGPWSALGLAAREQNGSFTAVDADAAATQAWFYRLSARMKDGSTVQSQVAKVEARAQIERTEIASLGPNPASSVRVEFTLKREQAVRLSVYDVTGREVAVLASGVEPAGRYTRTWGGGGANAGVYFMRFVTVERSETRRFAIVH
jgi:Divergent InlB B-repeat domain/Galactose oxidase, central domain